MAFNLRQLGQSRPSDANPASLYSPGEGVNSAVVALLTVCNSTAAAVTYRVFFDADGSTYDQGTAVFYDKEIAANDTHVHRLFLCMDDTNGNLAVRSSTGSALTFTACGVQM